MMNTPQAIRNGTARQPASDDELELLNADDRLQEEMQRLAAINKELLGQVSPAAQEAFHLPEEPDELAHLRAENAELRARVEELEHALQASAPEEDTWSERQKEYEALVEEKSEVIRALHMKMQQLQEGGATAPPTDSSDIQRLKKELAEQRRKLEEDEEAVMQQMRQMEMAMSKDRAELARQRNEVQRLHNELNREIEMASRDPGLRERLVALQRLQGEITGRKQAMTTPPPPTKQPTEIVPAAAASAKKQSSGLLRRIFGK
jgi:chromosome segregation ATPase